MPLYIGCGKYFRVICCDKSGPEASFIPLARQFKLISNVQFTNLPGVVSHLSPSVDYCGLLSLVCADFVRDRAVAKGRGCIAAGALAAAAAVGSGDPGLGWGFGSLACKCRNHRCVC